MKFILSCLLGCSSVLALPGGELRIFKEAGNKPLRLYVFSPANHKASDTRPAILFFFGGGWDHGSPTQFVKQASYFAGRGMVAICPEYRTRQSHGTTPFECVADGKAAVRWLRVHAKELGIDPQRIAASGGSAGGHVAVSTATLNDVEGKGADTGVSCVPNALVLFNPVLDTTATGYGAKKLGDRSRDASPAHHIRAGLPTTIIFHGTADKTVPFENAQRFTAEMKQAGNACTLMSYDGGGHGFYRFEPHYTSVLREVDKFFVSLGWLAAAPRADSAPVFSKQDVLVRGTDGHHTYRIPGLVATRSGALLLFADGRVNGAGDLGKMNLVLKRSRDGGATWEKLQVLADDPGPETKIGNVSAVADHTTGAVHAIYCKDLTRAYCLTSTNDGASFLPAVEITDVFRQFPFAWKYFATGHAHGIQLASGRLMTPVFLSSSPRTGPEATERDFRVGVIYSDDHGAHWQAGGLVPGDSRINESTVYECADGAVVINSRSVARSSRVMSRSTDAGLTWSEIAGVRELTGPACQASTLVTRDAAGKRVVLFSGPTGKNRSGLTVRLSYDDGQTWPIAKVIEPGPSAYGDLAAGPDGTIYLSYENGTKSPYEKISVARFNLDWLIHQP